MKNLLISFGLVASIGAFAQTCPTSVTITTNNYSTALTQSSTWIKSSSSVIGTSSVKFDANSQNGYVELNPGFLASPSSSSGVFIAQALDGCGVNVPAKLSPQAINDPSLNSIVIYPNPTSGIFTVAIQNETEGVIQVVDVTGKKIQEQNFKNSKEIHIDITSRQQGVYVVKVITNGTIVSKKIVKF